MQADAVLREQLLALLRGGNAHMSFDEAIADFPLDRINERPPNVTYTPWHLLEHLRRTQRDILDFIRDPDYREGNWPDDYWPAVEQQADRSEWAATIEAFREDLKAVRALVSDPATDLSAAVPYGQGQTMLREILLVADHNAYHIGEFAVLRQVMGAWPERRGVGA